MDSNFVDKLNNNELVQAIKTPIVEHIDIKPLTAVQVTTIPDQVNTRKRKLQKIEAAPQVIQETNRMSPQQHRFLNFVTHQIQLQQASTSPKQIPTIAVDDNRQIVQQLHQNGVTIDIEDPKNNLDEDESKAKTSKDGAGVKYDSFEIFGLFVANEMRGLTSNALKKKLKRKILELVLDVSEEDTKESL